MIKNSLQHWAKLTINAFKNASEHLEEHVEPVFREAAEGSGEDGGGVTWHTIDPMGLPGAKFHAMTGQSENTQVIRQNRAAAKGYANQVLDRADYYDSFEQYNNFSM